MASDRNPTDLELTRPSWPVTQYHDILLRIGQAMRLQYELPQELPDRLLTLLMQVTGQEEKDKAA
jgi:hypothetical protein